MGKVKNSYSPEDKVRVVLEGLQYPDGIAKYCRSKGIRGLLYRILKEIGMIKKYEYKKRYCNDSRTGGTASCVACDPSASSGQVT